VSACASLLSGAGVVEGTRNDLAMGFSRTSATVFRVAPGTWDGGCRGVAGLFTWQAAFQRDRWSK
jgi:hypothetical protein